MDFAAGLVRADKVQGAIRLDARGVTRVVPHRKTGEPFTLVDQVSFSIYPSELVGVMGPSGSGKTTMLLALNGYESPQRGNILINGEDLYANFERFRGLIGYVPQDDVLHQELTVWEACRYAARLRLPPDTTSEQIDLRVEEVLSQLMLTEQRDLQIGSVEEKVLSGGQRKRVSLAMELVTDPVLLFLDEPTSGLSARDTTEVMEVLAGLADRGRTIILTIHQPSPQVYARMDHVIMLGKGGKLAYYGPTDPDSYQYFGVEDQSPETVMNKLEEKTPAQWESQYKGSPQHRQYVQERQADQPDVEPLRAEIVKRSRPSPPLRQWWILFQRYGLTKVRDRGNMLFILFQGLLVGLLITLVFPGAKSDPMLRGTPIYMLCIAAIFFGCFNACREIVRERAIYRRERMATLKVVPYVFSKFVFLGLLGLVQTVIMYYIVAWGSGLEGDSAPYLLILGLTSLASTAMGLVISSLVRSPETAMAVVPIVLVFHIVLSGFLAPLEDEKNNITYTRALAAPMVSRWSVEGLLDVELEGLMIREERVPRGADELLVVGSYISQCRRGAPEPRGLLPPPTYEEAWRCFFMEKNKLEPKNTGVDVMVLGLFLVIYLGAALWLVRSKDVRL